MTRKDNLSLLWSTKFALKGKFKDMEVSISSRTATSCHWRTEFDNTIISLSYWSEEPIRDLTFLALLIKCLQSTCSQRIINPGLCQDSRKVHFKQALSFSCELLRCSAKKIQEPSYKLEFQLVLGLST